MALWSGGGTRRLGRLRSVRHCAMEMEEGEMPQSQGQKDPLKTFLAQRTDRTWTYGKGGGRMAYLLSLLLGRVTPTSIPRVFPMLFPFSSAQSFSPRSLSLRSLIINPRSSSGAAYILPPNVDCTGEDAVWRDPDWDVHRSVGRRFNPDGDRVLVRWAIPGNPRLQEVAVIDYRQGRLCGKAVYICARLSSQTSEC